MLFASLVSTLIKILDPPEKLALNAEEISENSLKVSWKFLNNNRDSSDSLPYISSITTKNNNNIFDLVDGYVLTFAKVSSPIHLAATKSFSAKQTSGELMTITNNRTIINQAAAHISSQRPAPNNDNDNSFVDTQWQAIQLAPQQKSHQLKNLECGTSYAMKIWAFNKIGKGEPSDLLSISTKGKGGYLFLFCFFYDD